jgi:hypothetical protein
MRQKEIPLAEEVTIPGTSSSAKIRNPLGVVGLMIITLGIYGLFWYYFVNRELKDFGEAHGTEECGTSPGTSLLAITLGALIIVPPFVSIYKSFKRMNAASGIAGAGDGFDAGLGLLIWIFISPIAIYLFQANMNKIWEAPSAPAAPAVPAEPAA